MFVPVTRGGRTVERAEEIVEAVSWAAGRALIAPSGRVSWDPTNLLSQTVDCRDSRRRRRWTTIAPSPTQHELDQAIGC